MKINIVEDKKEDVELAKKARINACSPYNNYQVGAALRTKSGKIYLGCNIINKNNEVEEYSMKELLPYGLSWNGIYFTAYRIWNII